MSKSKASKYGLKSEFKNLDSIHTSLQATADCEAQLRTNFYWVDGVELSRV